MWILRNWRLIRSDCLNKCKTLEITVKNQTKEIDTLKEKVQAKNKQLKTYESDIESFKEKIVQVSHIYAIQLSNSIV